MSDRKHIIVRPNERSVPLAPVGGREAAQARRAPTTAPRMAEGGVEGAYARQTVAAQAWRAHTTVGLGPIRSEGRAAMQARRAPTPGGGRQHRATGLETC